MEKAEHSAFRIKMLHFDQWRAAGLTLVVDAQAVARDAQRRKGRDVKAFQLDAGVEVLTHRVEKCRVEDAGAGAADGDDPERDEHAAEDGDEPPRNAQSGFTHYLITARRVLENQDSLLSRCSVEAGPSLI